MRAGSYLWVCMCMYIPRAGSLKSLSTDSYVFQNDGIRLQGNRHVIVRYMELLMKNLFNFSIVDLVGSATSLSCWIK